MAETLTHLDQLRIEWTVWSLDTLVQSLPGRARKAIREEMRANLRAAAQEVGAAQAVDRLGSLRGLAADYLEAEYGQSGPRPRLLNGVFWVLAVQAVLLGLTSAGFDSFVAGVEAGNPHPSGTYTWSGLPLFGIGGGITYDSQGAETGVHFTFALWALIYLLAAFVLGGRLWRLPAAWWRTRRRSRPGETPPKRP